MFREREVRREKLTRLGEAETVDSLGEVVHAHVLRFAAVLEEFLRGKRLRLRTNGRDCGGGSSDSGLKKQITDQSDGVREGAAQDVANLSELHPQDVGVQDIHFHRLVLPAPFFMRNADCRGSKLENK